MALDTHITSLANMENAECFEQTRAAQRRSIQQAASSGDLEAFLDILRTVDENPLSVDNRPLSLACLRSAASAGWPDVVESILHKISPITPDELMGAFMSACNAGSTPVAAMIHQRMANEDLSANRLIHCIETAASAEHVELLHFLLPMSQAPLLESALRRMLCLAAGQGRVSMLKFLASLDMVQSHRLQDALDESLSIAACNGHGQVCAHLITVGADICNLCLIPLYGDVHVELLDPESHDNADDERPAASTSRLDDLDQKRTKMNAIEFRMNGYRSDPQIHTRWACGDQAALVKTLRILLDSVASFSGSEWASTICKAAETLPIDLLKLMVEKGASAGAMMGSRNALSFAASRELDTMSAVQMLFDAHPDHGVLDLRIPLEAAVSRSWGEPWDPLFSRSRSLADIFTGGAGSAVQYFLRKLPLKEAKGKGYGLLLQMAAAAGQVGLIQLLIERHIDVNSTGHYYGTALQAASRYGHFEEGSLQGIW